MLVRNKMNEITHQLDQEVSLSESKLRRRVDALESGGEIPSKSAVEDSSSRRRPLSGGGGMNERRGRPVAKPVTCGLNVRLKPSPLVMSLSGINYDDEEASDNDDADARSSSSEASLHSKHTLDPDVVAAIEAIRSRRSKIAIELRHSRSKITVNSVSSSPTSVTTNLDDDRIVSPASIRRHPKGRSTKLQPINEKGGLMNEEVAPISEVKVSKACRRRSRKAHRVKNKIATASQEMHRPQEYNDCNDNISELWNDNMTVAISTMSDDITRQGSSSSSEASSEDDCSSKDLSSQNDDDDDDYSNEDDEDYSYTTLAESNRWTCSFIRDLRDMVRYLNSNRRRRR